MDAFIAIFLFCVVAIYLYNKFVEANAKEKQRKEEEITAWMEDQRLKQQRLGTMLLSKQDYKMYIASDTWQGKRQQRIRHDNFKCVNCECQVVMSFSPDTPDVPVGEVHHLHYATLGQENVFMDLVTLCPSCHNNFHKSMELDEIEKTIKSVQYLRKMEDKE